MLTLKVTKIKQRDLKWIFLKIYLKNDIVLKYLHKTGLKLVDLEINKGINNEYLQALHGSVVELHVGGADQQELEQQGLSNPLRQSLQLYHAGV